MTTYNTSTLLNVWTGRACATTAEANDPQAKSEAFGHMHGLITELLGWPVFTHQLAQEKVWADAKAELLRQHPWLDTIAEPDWADIEPDAISRWVDRVVDEHGATHEVHGPDQPIGSMSPFEGIPEGKPVIAVVVDDAPAGQ